MVEMNFFGERWTVRSDGLTAEQGAEIVQRALRDSRVYQTNREVIERVGHDVSRLITQYAQEATARGGRLPVEAPQAGGLHLEPPEPPPMTMDLKIEALPHRNAFNIFINGQQVMPGKGA